jgi:putative holliday junction resolvase
MSKILGIDYGEKRVGLAISDEEGKWAFVYKTLEYGEKIISDIKVICQTEGVRKIVLGLPLNQEGKQGVAAAKVNNFAQMIRRDIGAEVLMEDERFSTTMASAMLRDGGRNSKQSRAIIDQRSAQIILQTYLDRVHATIPEP